MKREAVVGFGVEVREGAPEEGAEEAMRGLGECEILWLRLLQDRTKMSEVERFRPVSS